MKTDPRSLAVATAVHAVRLAEAMCDRPLGSDIELWAVLRRAAEACERAADIVEAEGRTALEDHTP